MGSRKTPTDTPEQNLSASLPPARDPEIAVREEYALATAQGTAEALNLFSERHRGHPLAEQAQQMLAQRSAKLRP